MFQRLRNWIWSPRNGETSEDYVERVGGWHSSNIEMTRVLRDHYGMTNEDAKTSCLKSQSFWRSFFLEHVEKLHKANGARFAALNYIRRKNDPLGNGEPTFTQEEIDELVDAFGPWKR